MNDHIKRELDQRLKDYEQLLEACREAGLMVGRTWDGFKVVPRTVDASGLAEEWEDVKAQSRHGNDVSGRIDVLRNTDQKRIEDLSHSLVAAIERAVTAERKLPPIDNGNPYIFCNAVEGHRGCVRGAGHNGPHAFCLPPHPLTPVTLKEPT